MALRPSSVHNFKTLRLKSANMCRQATDLSFKKQRYSLLYPSLYLVRCCLSENTFANIIQIGFGVHIIYNLNSIILDQKKPCVGFTVEIHAKCVFRIWRGIVPTRTSYTLSTALKKSALEALNPYCCSTSRIVISVVNKFS